MVGEPSASELARDIARLSQDISALRAQLAQDYVLTKVYDAVVGALADRVRRLEDEQAAARSREEAEQAANRRTRYASAVTAAVSILTAVATVVINNLLRG